MPSEIHLLIDQSAVSTPRLMGIICANTTFLAIYAVVFTILISLAVYIYGIKDKVEKAAVIKASDIAIVLRDSLLLFALTFFAVPSPMYEFVNYILVASLLLKIWNAFRCIIHLNKNELSSQKLVSRYKEGIILQKLDQLHNFKDRNELLNKELEKRGIDRFIFEEELKFYDFIRFNKKSGYIDDVLFENLPSLGTATEEPVIESFKTRSGKYYIPYEIAIGNEIKFEDVLFGVRKIKKDDVFIKDDVDEEKIRAMISTNENLENPLEYLKAEIQGYFPKMFDLISSSNFKVLESELGKLSKFVDLFVKKPDSYTEIVQFMNDDIILPLQKQAFKKGDMDTIRTMTGFSVQYIYKSIHEQLDESFKIFLRNVSVSFYESFEIKKIESRKLFYEIFMRRLYDLCRWYIRPKL